MAFGFGFAALSMPFHELTTNTAELKITEDALAEDTAALEDARHDRQAKTDDFEASTKSRFSELAAPAQAQTVISRKTGGAESFSFCLTQTSFLSR